MKIPDRANRISRESDLAAAEVQPSLVLTLVYLVFHVPLALAMKAVPMLGVIHALVVLGVGIALAVRGGREQHVACVAAYIVGAEVLWRMSKVELVWEFGKYALVAVLIVSMLRNGRFRSIGLPVLYLFLLIPGALLTLFSLDFLDAKDVLSFSLSGPLSLAVACMFFSHVKLSRVQALRLLTVLVGPIVGILVIGISGMSASTGVAFGTGSNFIASAGFGPNQVSATLGMGCLACFLLAIDAGTRPAIRVLFLIILVLFGIQSALTFSRSGVYYSVASIALGGVFFLKSPRLRLQFSLLATTLFLVLYFLVFPRLESFTGGALGNRFSSTNLTGRSELAQADLKIFAEHPVLGVGAGQSAKAHVRYYGEEASSHTEFTRLLSEHGILGVAALIVLAIIGFKAVAGARTVWTKALAMSMLTFSCVFMLGSAMRLALPGFAYGLSLTAAGVERRVPPRQFGRRIRRVQ